MPDRNHGGGAKHFQFKSLDSVVFGHADASFRVMVVQPKL
jgi:hypothetical protein